MYQTLISASELAAHIDDPTWVVVDCRHDLMNLAAGREGYAAGHLPGAVFADIETALSGAKRGEDGVFRGRHPLPEKEALAGLLRWLGHEAVAVLDGGMAAWQALGRPLSTDVPARPPGAFSVRAPFVPTVTVRDVMDNLAHGQRIVIDARAADRFRGENETIDPVGGHIPGAKNRFFKDNLQPDGRFKDAAQLREEFGALIDDPTQAIKQCGSGVTACHNLLALEVAGLPGAAL